MTIERKRIRMFSNILLVVFLLIDLALMYRWRYHDYVTIALAAIGIIGIIVNYKSIANIIKKFDKTSIIWIVLNAFMPIIFLGFLTLFPGHASSLIIGNISLIIFILMGLIGVYIVWRLEKRRRRLLK